jgi:hypothetical protein
MLTWVGVLQMLPEKFKRKKGNSWDFAKLLAFTTFIIFYFSGAYYR